MLFLAISIPVLSIILMGYFVYSAPEASNEI